MRGASAVASSAGGSLGVFDVIDIGAVESASALQRRHTFNRVNGQLSVVRTIRWTSIRPTPLREPAQKNNIEIDASEGFLVRPEELIEGAHARTRTQALHASLVKGEMKIPALALHKDGGERQSRMNSNQFVKVNRSSIQFANLDFWSQNSPARLVRLRCDARVSQSSD